MQMVGLNSPALRTSLCSFFFFNDTATTEIYPLSLHDALPISPAIAATRRWTASAVSSGRRFAAAAATISTSTVDVLIVARSEEHTSELQSRLHLVCRLLLEKKKHRQAQLFPHDRGIEYHR